MLNENGKDCDPSKHSYVPTISAKHIQITPPPSAAPACPVDAPFAFKTNLEGALWWFNFGYRVIPLVSGEKRPAVKHFPWLADLDVAAIRQHWDEHPEHEVGAVLDHTQLVLDADTEQAHKALKTLALKFALPTRLVIKTKRGFHHHFRLLPGVFAKSDSHDTAQFPERIDIRADRNSALLTPSRDKSIVTLRANSRTELTPVPQAFVDAVFEHNGRAVPRPDLTNIDDDPAESTTETATLARLLENIDPDCGYQDWLNVLMAIYHETGGCEEGFNLANSWSKRADSYCGESAFRTKWRSFRNDLGHPITVATLIARARSEGADALAIMHEDFQPCATEVVAPPAPKPTAKRRPWEKHSLRGQAAKYADLALAATPLLGEVCYRGEATVWYAKHNTGKTLLFLHMLTDAVEQARIAAGDVFFINADDSSAGIAAKLVLMDELGAHTLVPGQSGFKAEDFQMLLMDAVRNDTARGTLVVIDTLKKFVDLMNKKQASDFANVCRQFISAGGTILGLAHVNKRRGDDGKVVHAGTTDILDDFDAGYTIDELPGGGSPGERMIEFKRLKGRGGGVESVAYLYAAEDGVSYAERLASVRVVDPTDLAIVKRVEEQRTDAQIIAVVESCIRDGVNMKIALRNAVAEKANISRRQAANVIERYTGDEPGQHRWTFVRKARGAMAFVLHGDGAEPEGEGPAATI